MEKNIAFRIENDYVGYLDLGFYNIPLADDYEAHKSFYSFSSAIKELFDFLESDNGKAFCVDNPKSNFNILKFYATGKKDNRGKSVITEKIVFKISAKEVENLRKLSSLENGGYTDLSKSKPEVINEAKMAEYDAQIPEIDIEKIRTIDLDIKDNKITSLDDSIRVLKQIYDKGSINAYEEVKILFLDNSNKVIGIYNHSKGGITGTVIDVEMVCALALKCLAKGVIMSHNHPSGALKFSNADIQMTKSLKNGLNLFNIALLDSIVITEYGFASMVDEGILLNGGNIRKAEDRKGFFAGGGGLKFGSYGEIRTKKFTDKDYEVIVNPEKLEINVIITNKDTIDQEALEDTGILFRKEDFGYSMEADNKTEYNKALKVLLGVAKRFESGGGLKRKMDLSDSVIYQDKVWYITEKNGVVGLMNFKQGSWGSNYPFIPLSRISQSEITDMMGREVEIPYLVKDFAYGGDFPDVGETIKGSDIDYDMKDYFNRTNKKLIITTKDNKIHTGGSVGKFYNDLIFIAKDKFDIPIRDILKVKILK